jgi:hypothetical protein
MRHRCNLATMTDSDYRGPPGPGPFKVGDIIVLVPVRLRSHSSRDSVVAGMAGAVGYIRTVDATTMHIRAHLEGHGYYWLFRDELRLATPEEVAATRLDCTAL